MLAVLECPQPQEPHVKNLLHRCRQDLKELKVRPSTDVHDYGSQVTVSREVP